MTNPKVINPNLATTTAETLKVVAEPRTLSRVVGTEEARVTPKDTEVEEAPKDTEVEVEVMAEETNVRSTLIPCFYQKKLGWNIEIVFH